MSVTESAMRTHFPNEIVSKPDWLELVKSATKVLDEEVKDSGVVIPTLLADWRFEPGNENIPVLQLRLSDIPNDPGPARGAFSLEALGHEAVVRASMRRLLSLMLHNRSRRQTNSLGLFIAGHHGGSSGQ